MISIWIWPLWMKRSYTIWLLLGPEVLSTHLKTNTIYYTDVQPWPDPTSQDPLLEQNWNSSCPEAMHSLQRYKYLGPPSVINWCKSNDTNVKWIYTRWWPGPEPLRKSLTFNQKQWIICFFSGVSFDTDCCSCVHSAFRLKVVRARTQGLYH